jgi:hypothetical protein
MEIDFYNLYYAARDAQILWKKRRQHAEGKININAEGGSDWTVDECNDMIKQHAATERWIYNQLPERARLEDAGGDYVVDAVLLRYEPQN